MTHSDTNTTFLPKFFDKVQPIKLVDPLSSVLGATNEGEAFVYHYTDIVKFSGHSCPAVSGAFKMTQLALQELYETEMPVRGQILVQMKGTSDSKVNGPVSQVISFITGAAGETGFKGLSGKFSRHNLMTFTPENSSADDVTAEAIFERMDNGKKTMVTYKSSLIPMKPEMGQLIALINEGHASNEQKQEFGNLWQERVQIVLMNPPAGAFTLSRIK